MPYYSIMSLIGFRQENRKDTITLILEDKPLLNRDSISLRENFDKTR